MESKKRYSYLTSEIDTAYHGAALKLGLSDSAMRILYTICLRGGSCALSEMVSLSGISKQTVNSALRKLEKNDIVYLETINGRNKMVYLTGKGKTLAQRTAGQVLKIEEEIFSSWTAEELETYIRLTEKYLSSFKEKIMELNL